MNRIKSLAKLPEGWDERTSFACTPSGRLVIAHPDHEPMYLADDLEWRLLKAEFAPSP